MITTRLHKGQGLGNQLWCYAVARAIAADKGYAFGITAPENWKGRELFDLDMGLPVQGITQKYSEKKILHPLNGSDIRLNDPALMNVSDGTEIDGYMQDEQYILDRKNEIRNWLKIRDNKDGKTFSSDDTCVINFRGGEYAYDKAFFLPGAYWENAIANMRRSNSRFKFVVITDDVATAKKFFPHFEVFHFSVAGDYMAIASARYLILSNSSFGWFPAWLSKELKVCIAPKYWGRHSISDGYWSLGYNITKGWLYQDRKGDLFDYDECRTELTAYMKARPEIYAGADFKRSFITSIKSRVNIFNALRKDMPAAKALWNIFVVSFIGGLYNLGLAKKMKGKLHDMIIAKGYY